MILRKCEVGVIDRDGQSRHPRDQGKNLHHLEDQKGHLEDQEERIKVLKA